MNWKTHYGIPNGIRMNPKEIEKEVEDTELSKTLDWLYTYAPFPGNTSWSSMVIWLGGIIMFLPLWVIFFVQSFWARREGKQLILETGPIGGVIQLYFAGAFSFMPLTSDVIVPNASTASRGRIAAVGLIVPTILAGALWYLVEDHQLYSSSTSFFGRCIFDIPYGTVLSPSSFGRDLYMEMGQIPMAVLLYCHHVNVYANGI